MAAALESQERRTAVHRTADQLRNEILFVEEGTLLGSEESLLARLGVSRPTLRQTARLLEQEQILTVRRGVKGGYYSRTPDVGAVAHIAAFHLKLRNAPLLETFNALEPLLDDAFRAAAQSKEASARAAFDDAVAGILQPVAECSQSATPERVLLDEETLFLEAVVALAGNPAIELVIRILYEFCLGKTGERPFQDRPDRVQEWREARERVIHAIQRGEVETAGLLEKDRRELLSRWFDEVLADRSESRADATGTCRAS